MRRLSCLFLLVAGLWPLCAAADPLESTAENEPAVLESQEEIIQRILELRRQIDDLLQILPEEVRQEIEQRWREQAEQGPERPEHQIVDEPVLEPPSEPEPESEPAMDGDSAAEASTPVEEMTPVQEEPVSQASPPPCGGFHLLDSNEDLLISGGDRQWRFLRLWFDDNGNGELEETEIQSPFELGVRQIDVNLKFYVNDEGSSEDVDVDQLIWLRMVGKGASNQRSGALAVAADRLSRDGRLWLTDESGTQLAGYQLLAPLAILETRDGERYPVVCQEPE